ncbi:MAG TPA: bifunctional glutamate N-acetyltransferase/amino-acid acetyltransferase ArgJ [Opitutales bacterium]|nr:bifunctional glutamate N-acetyltransferase/amino-acid acetyltransferase ArgJ [Opitutales bacterium]
MENYLIEEDSPGISDVPGFLVAGSACDIRNKGNSEQLDIALIYSEKPCAGAAVFTQNVVKAAPVRHGQAILKAGGPIHGIVANSGNANACTGQAGIDDTYAMARVAAEGFKKLPESFFVCSTGRIGERLPMQKVENGIRDAVERASSTPEEGRRAAAAILTSDTHSKTITVRFSHNGKKITVAGIAKGAGMIQPNMATMLAFLATDAAVEPSLLQKILSEAVRLTFNRITVDGDMSTNDTVLALANGESGVSIDESDRAGLDVFAGAVRKVCDFLAEKIVSDGEKITKVVEVLVEGAASEEDAEKVARAIGNSLLVKTSWYGNDPNWGRLADAAGYSGADFDDRKFDIYYADVPAVIAGEPCVENREKWKEIVRAKRFPITVRLNVPGGNGSFRLLATDLTEDYVRFNKSE